MKAEIFKVWASERKGTGTDLCHLWTEMSRDEKEDVLKWIGFVDTTTERDPISARQTRVKSIVFGDPLGFDPAYGFWEGKEIPSAIWIWLCYHSQRRIKFIHTWRVEREFRMSLMNRYQTTTVNRPFFPEKVTLEDGTFIAIASQQLDDYKGGAWGTVQCLDNSSTYGSPIFYVKHYEENIFYLSSFAYQFRKSCPKRRRLSDNLIASYMPFSFTRPNVVYLFNEPLPHLRRNITENIFCIEEKYFGHIGDKNFIKSAKKYREESHVQYKTKLSYYEKVWMGEREAALEKIQNEYMEILF